VKWLPVFVSQASYQIVAESLSFCHRAKQLCVNAYVIGQAMFGEHEKAGKGAETFGRRGGTVRRPRHNEASTNMSTSPVSSVTV
jgi:hypothetical protein